MGPDMLQPVYVAQDRLGQVRQVALAEVTQRQLAKALGQADADVFYLAVYETVGGLINEDIMKALD